MQQSYQSYIHHLLHPLPESHTPTDYHQIFATKPITMYNIAFTNSVIDEEIISNFLNYESGIVINLSENKLNQIKTTIKLIQEIFNSHRSNNMKMWCIEY